MTDLVVYTTTTGVCCILVIAVVAMFVIRGLK